MSWSYHVLSIQLALLIAAYPQFHRWSSFSGTFWHHRTNLSGYIFGTKACINNRKKNSLNSNTSSACPDNIVNFDLLTAEICLRVWGTAADFNGFHILATKNRELHKMVKTLPIFYESDVWFRR